MMPGFSFLATLVVGLGAWAVRRVSDGVMLGGLVGGLALTGAGLASDLGWPINLGVLVTALFVGVGIGRMLPPRPGPIFLLLFLLSVADVVWIVFVGGSGSEWVEEVSNFSVAIGTGSSSLGTADLVLAAVVTTHWLQRGAGVWLALAAAPIGMIVSNVYVALSGADNLPLVPFITLGWLATQVWHRRTRRSPSIGA